MKSILEAAGTLFLAGATMFYMFIKSETMDATGPFRYEGSRPHPVDTIRYPGVVSQDTIEFRR